MKHKPRHNIDAFIAASMAMLLYHHAASLMVLEWWGYLGIVFASATTTAMAQPFVDRTMRNLLPGQDGGEVEVHWLPYPHGKRVHQDLVDELDQLQLALDRKEQKQGDAKGRDGDARPCIEYTTPEGKDA